MPVYEQGYETYAGERRPLGRRWMPLFREEILPYFKKRRFVFLLFLAIIPWLWGISLTFLHTQLGDAAWAKDLVGKLPQVDESLVASLLANGYDIFLLLIVVIWVGSGLVARDRKDRTLEVFLSRAVSPTGYLWAKASSLLAFLVIFSVVPVAVLVVFQVGLTGEVGWLWEHSRVIWGTLLYAFVGQGALTLFVLALSSLGRSPRAVGLSFIGIFFLSDVVCGILYGLTREPSAWFISLSKQLGLLASRCLGSEPPSHLAMAPHLTVLFFALLAAGSVGILVQRFSRRGVLR
jgi:ABC-type transport system involved in multi-copper enzyme maturation permease subunit